MKPATEQQDERHDNGRQKVNQNLKSYKQQVGERKSISVRI